LFDDKQETLTWLAAEWSAKLAASIEMMTEARPAVQTGPRISEAPSEALWYRVPLNLGSGAAVLICATEENWLAIGGSVLQAAGLKEITPADARRTYLEILTQATSGLAQTLSAKLGKSVDTLQPEEIKADGAPGLIPVDLTLNEPSVRRIYVGWTPGLELQLAPVDRKLPERAEPAAKSATLDLLMEVELPVSVSFGRAELPLRDVLKLNSGSIVELNRTISDPVEIIVNNCVIARGEVVVVEGNYGVRIHQVISREERLRTLK
jgi:flagellar motor switch protein FliN/FliY